ncbi:cobyrinate a,c-diamide synthase, partial [Aeromicrobium sp.]|uniref:cobyrinate a,c-diamide synthase n=1 Tax=Aeromicrobium sp. TaxID=1871063 RepID=UPI0028ABC6E6
MTLPRVLVAAPASGHGKTTIATGLMAALTARGLAVSGHKVGPDYIDPGYHALATGRPGRNLDPHLTDPSLIAPLLLHGARGADLAVVEGVMGLFDGQIGGDGFASTAHVATLTDTPVVLVVDVSHASRTIGAVVHGMATFEPGVTIAGVILNKVGSERHATEVVHAIERTGIPVLGILHRDQGVSAPSRHLGLVPAEERAEAATALDRLVEQVTSGIDLDAVVEVARTAPPLTETAWDPAAHVRRVGRDSPVVAVAAGRAFTFRYAETTELLEAAGCTVAP